MRKVTYRAGSTNQIHGAVFCKLRYSDPTCQPRVNQFVSSVRNGKLYTGDGLMTAESRK